MRLLAQPSIYEGELETADNATIRFGDGEQLVRVALDRRKRCEVARIQRCARVFSRTAQIVVGEQTDDR